MNYIGINNWKVLDKGKQRMANSCELLVAERRGICERPPALSRARLPSSFLVVMLLAGCAKSPSPPFELNTEGRDKSTIRRTQADAITVALEKLFGTPDVPAVPTGVPWKLELLKAAAGPIGGDAAGRQWGLYRRHCAGCHGISGDGAGPAAKVLAPYPRDFRNGTFKYTSTAVGAKPVREDLVRTLLNGIPGTAMPSFRKLPEDQREALIEYAHYLSVRGETELQLLQMVLDDEAELPLDLKQLVSESILPTAQSWEQARAKAIRPPELPSPGTPEHLRDAIARGRALFTSPAVQCVTCHGTAGDGRGEQTNLFDDWNKRKVGATPEQTRQLAGRFKLPVERLRPRDFTKGLFHGGERPVDQYWRVYCGIKGTPMPAFGPAANSPGVLTPEQIDDLVQYVRSLGPGAGR